MTEPNAWQHCAAQIAHDITNGATPPGTAIPSHKRLAARHGVATATIRRAIQHLTEHGVLDPAHGSGVYVRRIPKPEDWLPPLAAAQHTIDALKARIAELEAQATKKRAVPRPRRNT